MPEDNERILPLVDRPTPLMDRVRGESEEGELGFQMGKAVADFAQNDNPELKAEEVERLSQQFVDGLSSSLGAEPEEVREQPIDDFMSMLLDNGEEDLVVQTDDEDEPEEDDEEESEDSSSFSS